MKKIRWIVMIVLVCGTLMAALLTFAKIGADSVDDPQGISLREESAKAPRGMGFFHMAHSRSFRGGGLLGGK